MTNWHGVILLASESLKYPLHNATIARVLRALAGSLFQKFGFFMDCLRKNRECKANRRISATLLSRLTNSTKQITYTTSRMCYLGGWIMQSLLHERTSFFGSGELWFAVKQPGHVESDNRTQISVGIRFNNSNENEQRTSISLVLNTMHIYFTYRSLWRISPCSQLHY